MNRPAPNSPLHYRRREVSRIEKKALKKLEKAMKEEGVQP